MYQGGIIMDRRFIRQIKLLLLFEGFFHGASSLSKLFGETEKELEGALKGTSKWKMPKKLAGHINTNIFSETEDELEDFLGKTFKWRRNK